MERDRNRSLRPLRQRLMTQSGIADDFGANDDGWRTFLQKLLSGRWQTDVKFFFFSRLVRLSTNCQGVSYSLGSSLASARLSPFLFPISYAFSAVIPIHQAYRAWGGRQVSVYLRTERTWYLVTNPAPASLPVCSSIIRLIAHPRPTSRTG